MKSDSRSSSLKTYLMTLALVCAGVYIAILLVVMPTNDAKRFKIIDKSASIPNLVTYAPIRQMLTPDQKWDRASTKEMCVAEMSWCLLRSLYKTGMNTTRIMAVPSALVEASVSQAFLVDKGAPKGFNQRRLIVLASKRLDGEPTKAFMREVSLAAKRVGSMPIFSTAADTDYRNWVMASGGQGGKYHFDDPVVSSLVRFENPARTTWIGLYEAADGPRLAIVNAPSKKL